MFLREIKPSPFLASIVRLYRIIDFEFPNDNPVPPKAYTPRPEQCIQFFPTATRIEYPGNPSKKIVPKNALLIGQHTVVNSRTVFKKFLSLQIVFQPGALYRLLNIPQQEFFNRVIEAEDVISNEIGLVNEQLFHAKNHPEMIVIAETFVQKQIKKIKKEVQPIDLMTQQMLLLPQQKSLDWFVSNAFVCHRQFDRKFTERTGISPKEYLKIIRFDQAYRMKNRFPKKSWFNIAIDCGYYDYHHLSKDYQLFTGFTPAVFFLKESPERLLGTEEVY